MTAQFDEGKARLLVEQHDGCLEALRMNRKERRARRIMARREDIEQHLFQVGMAIAEMSPQKPIYADAKEFLNAESSADVPASADHSRAE